MSFPKARLVLGEGAENSCVRRSCPAQLSDAVVRRSCPAQLSGAVVRRGTPKDKRTKDRR